MVWRIFVAVIVVASFLAGNGVEGRRRSNEKDEVEELIESAGYKSEVHQVETDDFYHLKIHRIPSKVASRSTYPVFFMHGLFANAADYLMTGPSVALPYLLANSGYDCWLGNSRGSDYGLKHKFLSPSSKEFWDFSFHEIGFYDLQKMFDYVLEKTKAQKIYVIAHSQGCTSLMVLLSLRPQYNDKIIEGHLMAPAVFMKDLPHPFIRFFASEFNAFVERYKNYDIMSSSQIMKFIEPINGFLCQQNSPITSLCTNILSMVCGRNDNGTETDTKILPVLTKYLSHAVSTKQFHHFIQLYHSGKFQFYDYQHENKKLYNQSFPPEYPLKKVKAPMHLYSGVNDMLVAEKDIERLTEVLENVVTYKSTKNYNHCDFLYGKNSRALIYQSIVKALSRAVT